MGGAKAAAVALGTKHVMFWPERVGGMDGSRDGHSMTYTHFWRVHSRVREEVMHNVVVVLF